jgi:predicted ArsR family transcriptional regulator
MRKTQDTDAHRCQTAFVCSNRIGTQAACINAALTKEPQPLEGIASACKLGNQRVRSHMASLVKRGIAVQSKDGFALQ